jgi:predicted HAD superfamily phosphohydrolase YqeG
MDHFLGEISPTKLCMIGDRVSTDILFGNTHQMRTILVRPITSDGDNPLAKSLRGVENHIFLPTLRWFGYGSAQRPNTKYGQSI